MSVEANLKESLTISKEKSTIEKDSTSKSSNTKPPIDIVTETEILKKIAKHCSTWSQISNAYAVCIVIFGISAISTSVLVSIYTGQENIIRVEIIKVLACISTISLSILTAFNLVSNASNARNAWRSLNAAMMMYKAGSMSIQDLIEQYQKGENQVGNLSFSYGTNSDKPATYSHDIKGKSEEQGNVFEDKIFVGKPNDNEGKQNDNINKQNNHTDKPNDNAIKQKDEAVESKAIIGKQP